ncbi:hypothetical protein DFH09DRAFT_595605 [Mycena vulgaris]|nr:hypothetical protein DFH09DRAFT_595605 [Mycena vulgaris]
MLPFGLKLAWFALSLSGLIGCWAVLLPLAWAIQSYWGPIAYAVGITALEGVFCLGLIWKMNPVHLPLGFCIAQVLITGSAVFFVIGVLAAITTATTLYVAKPKQWGTQDVTKILPWRFYYLLPMLLFPLLASSVHVIFVIYFDNFDTVDGLTCTAHPLWVRFLGYAGTPFLITIPCLWLTMMSFIRVMRTHKHIRRARRSVNFGNMDHFTAIPQRRSRPALKTRSTPPTPLAITAPSPSPSAIVEVSREARRQAISPVLREKTMSFHLPFLPPSPEYITASSGNRSHRSGASFDTISSLSFADADVKRKSPPTVYSNEEDDVMTPLRSFITPTGTTRSTRSIRNSDRISITQLAFSLGKRPSSDGSDYFSHLSGTDSGGTPSVSGLTLPLEYRNPSELPSIIRSLLIFQFAIIAIHLLSSITPVVDLVSVRPAALGTQHVALLLAGWAPVFIFGPLSAVRCQLAFWR